MLKKLRIVSSQQVLIAHNSKCDPCYTIVLIDVLAPRQQSAKLKTPNKYKKEKSLTNINDVAIEEGEFGYSFIRVGRCQ